MKEYILYYNGQRMQLYLDKHRGLCIRRRENARYLSCEVLLADAACDFAAAVGGGRIHVVCQNANGSIIYFTYDGRLWEKTVLLESKEGRAFNKYFSLVLPGGPANVFYVISHDGRAMLVHQILDGTDAPPEVVDYINPTGIRFFAAEHISSDISLIYKNSQGICGSKLYRWSRKSFMPFIPITEGAGLSPAFALSRPGGMLYAAVSEKNGGSIMLIRRDNDGAVGSTEIFSPCETNAEPVLIFHENRLFVQWNDRGTIMSAYSADGGVTWTEPVKFVKNALLESTHFVLVSENEVKHCYGYKSDSDLNLYSVPGLFEAMEAAPAPSEYAIPGREAEEFAARLGYRPELKYDDAYVTENDFQKEIAALRRELKAQAEQIAAIKENAGEAPAQQ